MKIQYQTKQLTVFESALFRTTTTLIVTSDIVLLVDPNWLPIEITYLQRVVQKVRKNRPLYLLFTHSDYDHIIGYEAFPEAIIIAAAAFVTNPNKDSILQQIADFDDEYYIKRDYLTTYPSVDIEIHTDGQQLQIGETRLEFYLAPGHNRDGIFTILPREGIWIAGDYLSNIEFPYIYYSSDAYLQTIAKTEEILCQYAIKEMITGHGDVALSTQKINARKNASIQYIQTLKNSIATDKPFDLGHLFEKYHFPKIMQRFHDANVELVKKEERRRKSEE